MCGRADRRLPLRLLPREAPLPAWLAAHEAVLAALARDEAGEVSLSGAGSCTRCSGACIAA